MTLRSIGEVAAARLVGMMSTGGKHAVASLNLTLAGALR
jgi:hypothetical protein